MSPRLRHLPTCLRIRHRSPQSNPHQSSSGGFRRRATKLLNYLNPTKDKKPTHHPISHTSSFETLGSSASSVSNTDDDKEPNNSLIVPTPARPHARGGNHPDTDEDEGPSTSMVCTPRKFYPPVVHHLDTGSDEDEEPTDYSLTRPPTESYRTDELLDEYAKLQANLTRALEEVRARTLERRRMEEEEDDDEDDDRRGWRTADEILRLGEQAEVVNAETPIAAGAAAAAAAAEEVIDEESPVHHCSDVDVLEQFIGLLAALIGTNKDGCVELLGHATHDAVIAMVVFTIIHFVLAIFGLPSLIIVHLATGTWCGESLAWTPHWSVLAGAALCFFVRGAWNWLDEKVNTMPNVMARHRCPHRRSTGWLKRMLVMMSHDLGYHDRPDNDSTAPRPSLG